MANWNEFTWDDGTLWDQAQVTPASLGLSSRVLLVDWGNTGSFTGENEAANLIYWNIRRGRQYYVSTNGQGFDHVDISQTTLTMINRDGRYNPYNTNSPLYPNIKPGKYFQLSFKDNINNVNYLVMTGKIADITPISGSWEQVQFVCVDGLQDLADQNVNVDAVYYQKLSDMILQTLTASDWATRWGKNIQNDATPITIFELDSANAMDSIHSLADTGLGTFFMARTGKATYYPRNYAGMTTYNFDQAVVLKEWTLPSPWDQVRNMITVTCNRKVKQRLGSIWYLPDPVYVSANGHIVITATYAEAMDVSLYQYTANSEADSTGTDLHDNFFITIVPRGKSSDIRIFNGLGTGGGYLTSLELIGRTFVDVSSNYEDDDPTSMLDYGNRRFGLDTPYLQDYNFAKAYATIIKNKLKDARAIPIIQIEERPDIQYVPDLFDKIHITSGRLGIDDTFSVGMIEHIGEAGSDKGTTTRFYLQNVIYDDTVIIPAPRDKNLPLIPEIPNGINGTINKWSNNGTGGDWGSIPNFPNFPNIPINNNPPAILECKGDLHAVENGPYAIGFTPTTINAGEASIGMFPCWVRSADATNKTLMEIYGTFQGDAATNFHVDAIDAGQNVILGGVARYLWDGVYAGIGRADFSPAGGLDVAGFKISLNAGVGSGIGSFLEYYSKGAMNHSAPIGGGDPVTDNSVFTAPDLLYCASNGEGNFYYWLAMRLYYSGPALPYGHLTVTVKNLSLSSIQLAGANISDLPLKNHGGASYFTESIRTLGAPFEGGAYNWTPGTTIDKYLIVWFGGDPPCPVTTYQITSVDWWVQIEGEWVIYANLYPGIGFYAARRIDLDHVNIKNVCAS